MTFGQDSRWRLDVYFKKGTPPCDYFEKTYGQATYYSRPNKDEDKEKKSFRCLVNNQLKKYKQYIQYIVLFNNINNKILNPKTFIEENGYKDSYARK